MIDITDDKKNSQNCPAMVGRCLDFAGHYDNIIGPKASRGWLTRC